MDTNIAEKVERYNEIGQVVRVTLRWRGKIYYLQMFFPGSKFPSRGEVETQVKKIYPDAVVMIHYASETQPNQPLIRVTENVGVKRDQNMPYIKNSEKGSSKKDPNMTSDMLKTYRKNMTLSHEPQGETMNEQMTDKPNVPGSGAKKNVAADIKTKIKSALTNVKKQVEKNPAGMMLQNMSHEPEGEVIKEEEKENPTFVQFMKRIDQLPEVTREAIKNCGNDPAIAKAALEISGIDK